VKTGRFGLYVTDGEVNATLRLGDTPESITLDRAGELLAERRNAEPSLRPRKATKKLTKKAPAKRSVAKSPRPTRVPRRKRRRKSRPAPKNEVPSPRERRPTPH
jgi:DNA topoisomerase-1